MDDKKAFVFDTNFIIQTRAIDEVIANLSDRFSVYVTQVSVEERIAQQCRDQKARYNDLENLKNKCRDIATISLIKPYEELRKSYQAGIQKKYEDAFGDRLIPLSKDGAMLSSILDRANYKVAPFLSDSNASDKGFKDALIWESLISFFKDNGESEVIFITDDAGFTKNAAVLIEEFTKVTGKKLSIQPNSYYKELLKPELVEESISEPITKEPDFDVGKMREIINEAMSRMCYTLRYSDYGDEYHVETFTINQQVDNDYIAQMLSNIDAKYREHIFETELPASLVLDLDNRVIDGEANIEIAAIEEVLGIYRRIFENHPDYLNQFYSAVAAAINQHYRKQVEFQYLTDDDDSELPF